MPSRRPSAPHAGVGPLTVIVFLISAALAVAQSDLRITTPADGATVNNIVVIRAAATADVTSVTFSATGPSTVTPFTSTTAPFTWEWDTDGLSGTYTVTATAASGASPPPYSINIVIDGSATDNPTQTVGTGAVSITNPASDLSLTVVAGTVVRVPLAVKNPRNSRLEYTRTQTGGASVTGRATMDIVTGVFKFPTSLTDAPTTSTTYTFNLKGEEKDVTSPTSATAALSITVTPRQPSDGPIIRYIAQNTTVSGGDYRFLSPAEAIETIRKGGVEVYCDVERLASNPASPAPTIALLGMNPTPAAPPAGPTLEAATIASVSITGTDPFYASNALYTRWRVKPWNNSYAPVSFTELRMEAAEVFSGTTVTSTASAFISVTNDFDFQFGSGPYIAEQIYVMPRYRTSAGGTWKSLWTTGTFGLQPKPAPTISGTIYLSCQFVNKSNVYFDKASTSAQYDLPETMLVEYRINDKPIGPPVDAYTNFQFDTSTLSTILGSPVPAVVAISAHVIHSADPVLNPRVYDHRFTPRLFSIGIGSVQSGATTIPIAAFSFDGRTASNRFDAFAYDGQLPEPAAAIRPFTVRDPPTVTPSDYSAMITNNNQWIIEPFLHSTTPLYYPEPHLYRTADGRPLAGWHIVDRPGGTSEDSRTMHDFVDWWCGERNNPSVSPYSSFVPHPEDDSFVGVDISGRLFRVWPDGEVQTLAGHVNKAGTTNLPPLLPTYWLDATDLSVPGGTTAAAYHRSLSKTLVGTFAGGLTLNTPNDLAIDPTNANIIYIADSANHRIAKAELDTVTGIWNVSTFAGVGTAGFVDGGPTTAKFNKPYSIAVDAANGLLWVADKGNKAIRKIIISTATTVTVVNGGSANSTASINAAWTAGTGVVLNPTNTILGTGEVALGSIVMDSPAVVRLNSAGELIIGEDGIQAIRRFSLSTSTMKTVAWMNAGSGANTKWLWLDVDKAARIGPVDHIVVAQSVGNGNVRFHRIDPSGAYAPSVFIGGAGSQVFPSGEATQILGDAKGHYPWGVAIDDAKCRVICTGYGTVGPVFARRKLASGEPVLTNDSTKYLNGAYMMRWGTVKGFPRHVRPSFASVHGLTGHGRLGTSVVNFDDVTASGASDASIASFIQGNPSSSTDGGMSGLVDRPEITGRDLIDLIYYVKRNSLTGHDGSITIPSYGTDQTAPQIGNVAIYRVPPTSGDYGSLVVTWHTSEPTIGCVTLGQIPSEPLPRLFEIEAAYSNYSTDGNTHRQVIPNVKNGVDYFITIIAKDDNGNMTSKRF